MSADWRDRVAPGNGRTPAWAKTAKECNAEYAANKAAIKGTQKKADFITACKAGTEVVPGAPAAATPAVPPATAATQPPTPTAKPARAPKVAAPATPAAASAAPAGANQFPAVAQAQAHCPGGTVVWVNTKSSIYHFTGTKDFGTTKSGAYMCEPEAMGAGDRASKTEKHP